MAISYKKTLEIAYRQRPEQDGIDTYRWSQYQCHGKTWTE